VTFLQAVEELHGKLDGFDAAAELLCIRCRELGPGTLEVEYSSVRNLADVAEGMIRGCIAHFGGGHLEREDLLGAPPRGAFRPSARRCSPASSALEKAVPTLR
jgi:hypothetical protein